MNGKENIKHVTCRSHTARSDKDIYKVSPSKLTKRELEDLYFSLVENNTQLKKTINAQRDQIKILTTKVQRMTVQKSSLACQNKECCANTKAIIMEQKESIADLKKANERLSDRIRLLNMRLCSAKQFLRQSPAQSSSRCAKCCLTSTTSIKNTSLTALNTRISEVNLQTDGASSMYMNKRISTNGAVDIVPNETEIKHLPSQPCQQNRCRTVMEELKEKIGTFEKELSKTHEQYTERVRKVEDEMSLVREENLRVRAHKEASEQRLEVREREAAELLQKLRATEAQCDDLATQLQIEKSRVCELEMQLKASDISVQVAKALETHINTVMTNRKCSVVQSKMDPPTLGLCESEWEYNSPTMVRNNSVTTNSGIVTNNVNKSSDDSGYTESKTQELETIKDILNTEASVLDQIASLQAQLDILKRSVKHNPGDIKTNANLDHLQNSKSDSNEAYGVMGASSSLSDDIFQTSRVKATDQLSHFPSTSRAPDVLISSEDINKSAKIGVVGLQHIDKNNSHNIFPKGGSLPVDMPKMPYFGENGTSSKIILNKVNNIESSNRIHNAELDNEDNSNHCSLKNYINEKQTSLLNEVNKNDNIKLDKNIENDNTKDLLLDDLMKKRRRSSLRGSTQEKSNKDLSVTYDETKTIVGSTINFANIRDSLYKDVSLQANDIGNVIHAASQDDSDPSVEFKINERNMKKKIRYKNKDLDNASYEENETKYLDEKICGTDFGTEESAGIGTDIGKKLDNNDIVENNAQAFNTSSKKDESQGTYNVAAKPTNKTSKDANVEINDNNHLDICEHHARICTCPHAPRRDVALFRTCSGTLKFRTTSVTKNKFRQCHCSRDEKIEAVPKVQVKKNGVTDPLYLRPIDTSTPNRQRTYNIAASADVMRTTSPDNTDHEISSMTDLPNETEDKSPQDYISPGEEKATSTLTESYAATTTDYGSLSEGELPVTEAKKISYPDIEMKDKMTDSIALSTTSNRMEEALRAISDELTRCRELLQGQLPSQKSRFRDNSSMTEETPIELRRAEGKSRIASVSSPKCIFTIHVGTVVLSDQAVLCSRGKSLALTWRFYNQTATMTRMLAGRVMNFDFSTEYDLKITDHFLHYLKHEEMPIVICELDKQDEPFANCALPLRDALLHTNRRVDMSLALVAGPQLICQQSLKDLQSSEEVGVLDVWCLLRVEPSALSAINSAIVKPSSYKSQHRSSLLEQMLDDDQSVDYRFSQDLRLRRRLLGSTEYPVYKDDVENEKAPGIKSGGAISTEVPTNIRTIDDMRPTIAKKSSDSTSLYDILKSKKWGRRRSSPTKETRPEGNRQKSVSYAPKLSCTQESSLERVDTNDVTDIDESVQSIEITVLWLALNEDCKAMADPSVKKLYVAYSFMGRSGAELETPISLPKPKNYMDKLHFMFKKTFTLNECDLPFLGHLARCRQPTAGSSSAVTNAHDPKHCIVFSVVSEPPEDPLGLDSCEDVGFAYLYLGDVLAYSSGAEQYTAVVAVHAAGQEEAVCGALAVSVGGLGLLRRCLSLSYSNRSFEFC